MKKQNRRMLSTIEDLCTILADHPNRDVNDFVQQARWGSPLLSSCMYGE